MTLALLLAAHTAGAAPLRVDISANHRADMRTMGWENWRPDDGKLRRSFGNLTVTLRPLTKAGSLSLSGRKALDERLCIPL